jgi:hypothetical protein
MLLPVFSTRYASADYGKKCPLQSISREKEARDIPCSEDFHLATTLVCKVRSRRWDPV